MPNDPAVERVRTAEAATLEACAQGPKRIQDIFEAVRKHANSPNFPDAEMLTAFCNLSDSGKIIGRTIDGYYHAATPESWAAIDAAAAKAQER